MMNWQFDVICEKKDGKFSGEEYNVDMHKICLHH